MTDMSYQQFKELQDELEAEFFKGNYQCKIWTINDFDKILSITEDYSALTRRMLLYIKEKENSEEKDKNWLEYYLSLGK